MSTLQRTTSFQDLHDLRDQDLLDLAEQLDGRPVPGLRLTEQQFEAWCDEDVKAEWVDGEVILMPPSSGEHGDIAGWLYRVVAEFVEEHKLGLVRGPEFQVRLVLGKRRRRRVPDLLFVAESRRNLLRPTYLSGPPDLAMEVVSIDSQSRDRGDKYNDYESAGVREYWIIDPLTRRVEAHQLGKGKRYEPIKPIAGRLPSTVLRGFYLRPDWLWGASMPRVPDVLREVHASRRKRATK